MTRRTSRFLAAAALILSAGATQAATMTLDYVAEVTDIDGSATAIAALSDAGIVLGTDARGTVSLLGGIADGAPGDPTIGIYAGAVSGFTLDLNGVAASFDGSFNDAYVADDAADTLLATAAMTFGNPGLGPGLAGLQLRDSSGSVFGSDALVFDEGLYALPNFDGYIPFDADGTALLLSLEVGSEIVVVFAEIKVLQAKVVPLPAAVWMMAAALVSLGGLARRR